MTFLQCFHLLRARLGTVLAGVAAGALLAILWALLSTRSYDATAQVLVDVRAPETVGNQSFADQLAPDYLATQVDILRSRRVTAEVAGLLRLRADPAMRQAFAESGRKSLDDFLVATTAKGLTVAPVSTSRVISLTYSARDPAFAARAANAYARAYRDISLQLQTEPARQSVASYEAQARAVQDQLMTAQKQLSARERALAVASDSDQSDADVNRLNSLAGQLAQAQAQAATLGSRAAGEALPDAIASPVVQGIQGELAKLEAQRAQLATYAGPNNIDLIQLDHQIEGLRAKLAEQSALVARGAATAASQGAANVARLSADLARQRDRTIAARTNRDEVSVLKERVANLKQTYEQIMARRAQLGILSEGSQTNVSLLSSANPPTRPAWPRPLLMLALGIVLGGVAGIVVALVSELIDQRLRRPSDIETWLGIPNLGAIRRDGPATRRLAGGLRRLLPSPAGSR